MTRLALASAAALAIGLGAMPAAARVATPEVLEAARLRELHLMLNSANLRCKMIGINLQPGFDSFSARQAAPLSRAETALKQYFDVQSEKDLRAGYDRFHIKILNFYGTGRTDQHSCTTFANLLTMLAQADEGSPLLSQVAEIMVTRPLIEDEG